MGGLEANEDSAVLGANGVINGLYAAGEVMGGVHGKNRLGGNSLLDCVAFGRVAGASAAKTLLSAALKNKAMGRAAVLGGHINVNVDPASGQVNIGINFGGNGAAATASV